MKDWEAYLLDHVHMGTANSPNSNSDMVDVQILASKLSAILIERGRKHHVSMITVFIHILMDDKASVRLFQLELWKTYHHPT